MEKKNSFRTDRHWLTDKFFTVRLSMDDIVTNAGFYYSDIAPVQAKFKNFLGGYWPGEESTPASPIDCTTINDS